MRTSMRRDLTAVLRARDRVTVTALRSALAAIDNAEAPPAGSEYERIGRDELAQRLRSEADVLSQYVPAPS